MLDYKVLLKRKAKMPDVKTIQKDIKAADNWDDAYWIGRYVYEQASGEADKLIMDAYEKAFSLVSKILSSCSSSISSSLKSSGRRAYLFSGYQ